jgi:predicted restriction endonuclease
MNRAEKIVELWNKRYSGGQIGKLFGISRQRVMKIIQLQGLKMENMSEKMRAKDDISGIKIDPNLAGRERTRAIVRERDENTCQLCGKVHIKGERELDVHHIDCDKRKTRQYDRMSEIPNMITVCHSCHMNISSHIKAMEKGNRHLIKNPSPTEPFAGTVQNKL